MDTQSKNNMALIGAVDALYPDLQCVGVNVTGVGFEKGATICFKPDDSGKHDTIFAADSIEIDHVQVTEVEAGQQFGIKLPVPIEGLFEIGTLVFLVTEPAVD